MEIFKITEEDGEWQYAASYKDGSSWTPYNYASGATTFYNDATDVSPANGVVDGKDANDDIQSTSLKIGYDLVLPGVPVLTNINDAKLYDKDNYTKAVYKVKWGDSLYDIASELYHDGRKWPVIYEENKDEIEDMNELTVGQVLIIPLSSYHNSTEYTQN